MSLSSLGFIVLRHVNSVETNKLWLHCYNCIRNFYPENSIVIIDDNSNKEFITEPEIPLYNTTIIESEFPGRGELLPYYYYSINKFFDTAVMIHDGAFINKYIDFNVDNYKLIWDFSEHTHSQREDAHRMLHMFNDNDLFDFYNDKTLWSGCFGGMSIITHNFLTHINSKYDLSKLLDAVLNRYNRMTFERIIACLLQKEYKKEVLLGNILGYCNWGITFDEKHNYDHLPIIKVWVGR